MPRPPFARAVLLALASLCAASLAQAGAIPRYHVVDLGPGDAVASRPSLGAVGIDNGGRPVRWTGGQVIVLPTPEGRGDVVAFNASGAVAGAAIVGTGYLPATWSADGQFTDLSVPGITTTLSGIDDAGTVTGFFYSGTGVAQTGFFIDPDGTRHPLPMLGSGSVSLPWTVSAGGVIGAEVNDTSAGDTHCAFFANGAFTVLPGLAGFHYCQPVSITPKGHMVATAGDANYEEHAVLWRDGHFVDLGSFGSYAWAVGMNANDVVVGVSGLRGSKKVVNFVWARGVMRNLDTLIDPSSSGWVVQVVHGIDDDGRIAGVGRPPGQSSQHAILLVPVAQ